MQRDSSTTVHRVLIRYPFTGRGGFCVDTVTSARATPDILKSTPYDAIISDYQMPGLDDIGFLKLVREGAPFRP